MRRAEWSVRDARSSFGMLVSGALKGVPQLVTRRGKPAVVVLSATEYQRLTRRGAPGSFAEALLAMPQDDGTFEVADVAPRDLAF